MCVQYARMYTREYVCVYVSMYSCGFLLATVCILATTLVGVASSSIQNSSRSTTLEVASSS